MMAAVAAQTTVSKAQSTPAYEVASVREPAIDGRPPVFDETDDGDTMINVPLYQLIQYAFEDSNTQHLAPQPAWVRSTRFDVKAKFDLAVYPKPTFAVRQVMLHGCLPNGSN
jgi:uncharacterized protein (TIGR03435 family)